MSFDKALLGDVCEISMGQAPSGDTYNTDGEGLPLIAGAGDFGDLSPEATKFTTSPTKVSRPGDIILCIRATIGDRNWSDTEYCLGRGVAGLLGNAKKLDQRYLWHWLGYAMPELKAKGRGATFLQVNRADIGSLEVPLPSLAEQRRIAAILDKADVLRAKRRKAIAKLDRLLQSVFLDMFGDPVTNPKSWPVTPIRDNCEKVTVGIVVKPASYYVESGVPAIRSLNIGVNRIIAQNFVYFSEADNYGPLKKTILRAGDVIAVRSGQPGKAAVVPASLDGANAIDVLIARTKKDRMLPEFLARFLNSSAGRALVLAEQRGQVQKHLNVKQLSEAEIPLPPIAMQNQFLQTAGSFEALLGKMRGGFDKSDALFASIQRRAFTGTL